MSQISFCIQDMYNVFQHSAYQHKTIFYRNTEEVDGISMGHLQHMFANWLFICVKIPDSCCPYKYELCYTKTNFSGLETNLRKLRVSFDLWMLLWKDDTNLII